VLISCHLLLFGQQLAAQRMAAWISGERGKAASLTTGSSSWESVEQLVNSWPGSSSPGMNRGNRLRNKNYFKRST